MGSYSCIVFASVPSTQESKPRCVYRLGYSLRQQRLTLPPCLYQRGGSPNKAHASKTQAQFDMAQQFTIDPSVTPIRRSLNPPISLLRILPASKPLLLQLTQSNQTEPCYKMPAFFAPPPPLQSRVESKWQHNPCLDREPAPGMSSVHKTEDSGMTRVTWDPCLQEAGVLPHPSVVWSDAVTAEAKLKLFV